MLRWACAWAGDDAVAQEQEAQKKQQFDQLTEAASELLDLGFEDIYQDNREAIAATLGRCNIPKWWSSLWST